MPVFTVVMTAEYEVEVEVNAPSIKDINRIPLEDLLEQARVRDYDIACNFDRTLYFDHIYESMEGTFSNVFVVDNNFVTEEYYVNFLEEQKEKIEKELKEKPLPGQLGLAGIGEDIPKEEKK